MQLSDTRKPQPFNPQTRGFTLIEVMIVVAVMGLITVAAWPSYDRYQTKSRRTDGINALLDARATIEKCYINFAEADADKLGYLNDNCDIDTIAGKENSTNGYYAIAITNRAAETYTLTAKPQGVQVDPECTELTLTHLGVKGFTNTNIAPDPIGTLGRCWSQ
jgi:type IV pilus assembly protein PilE